MHTFEANGGTVFNFNSDLSGDVFVAARGEVPVKVPGDDLLDFVANFVRNERISALENATTSQVLGLSTPAREEE